MTLIITQEKEISHVMSYCKTYVVILFVKYFSLKMEESLLELTVLRNVSICLIIKAFLCIKAH